MISTLQMKSREPVQGTFLPTFAFRLPAADSESSQSNGQPDKPEVTHCVRSAIADLLEKSTFRMGHSVTIGSIGVGKRTARSIASAASKQRSSSKQRPMI